MTSFKIVPRSELLIVMTLGNYSGNKERHIVSYQYLCNDLYEKVEEKGLEADRKSGPVQDPVDIDLFRFRFEK